MPTIGNSSPRQLTAVTEESLKAINNLKNSTSGESRDLLSNVDAEHDRFKRQPHQSLRPYCRSSTALPID